MLIISNIFRDIELQVVRSVRRFNIANKLEMYYKRSSYHNYSCSYMLLCKFDHANYYVQSLYVSM